MDLICRTCGTGFAVDDAMVPAEGGRFPCPKCANLVPAAWPALELALDESAVTGRGREKLSSAPSSSRLVGVTVEDLAAEREAEATQKALEIVSEAPTTPVEADPSSATRGEQNPALAPAAPLTSTGEASAAPAAGTASGPGGRSAAARPPGMVVISASATLSPWRLYAAVGGTALAAVLVVVLVGVARNRPPPPPKMPNPMQGQVAQWLRSGVQPPAGPVETAVLASRVAFALGTDRGVRAALRHARGALMVDADAPAAIAAYGLALAWLPEWVDDETLDQSLGGITSAIGENPDSVHRADLEEARAWLHIRRHRLEAARQSATRAVQLRPGAARARLAEAITRIRSRPTEVGAELDAMAGEAPPHLALWRGEARLLAGEVGSAIRLWEKALGGTEKDAPILRRLASLWLAAGDLVAARARLRELTERGWASIEDRIQLARLMVREEKNPQGAMVELDAALAEVSSPVNRARVLADKVAVGLASRKAGTATEWSAWLDEALELAPDLPELLYTAGLADLQGGNREAGIESLEAANELRPDRPEVAFVLAQALEADSLEVARQVVAQALAEAPQAVPLHLLRAWLDQAAGDPVSAATAVRRALDIDPLRLADEPTSAFVPPLAAYNNLARQMALKGRKTDNPIWLTAAAVAFHFARDPVQAQAMLNRAIRSDPNEVGARLYRAIYAYRRNQWGPARRDLTAASKVDSRHRIVRHYQALLSLQRSKTAAEGERIWRDLLDANTLDATARVGLARALWVRGQREDAREQAIKVLSVRPDDRDALTFFLLLDREPARKTR